MNLPRWLRAAGSALIAALLPACDIVNLPQIQPGVTTAAEVRQHMGEPGFVHRNDDGTKTWEYSRQPAGVTCYMIRFDSMDVVSAMDQVINEKTFAQIQPGLTPEQVRRLLGAPASKVVFDNLGEDIWEWHFEDTPKTGEAYFMVHFDLNSGLVKKTSKRTDMRG